MNRIKDIYYSDLSEKNYRSYFFFILFFCGMVFFAQHLSSVDQINYFIIHNLKELEFKPVSLFLFNYSHINLIHLLLNLFFFYKIIQIIAIQKIINTKQLIFIHTFGALIIGILLYLFIHSPLLGEYFEQGHLGYSAILFSLFAILWFAVMKWDTKIFNLIFIITIYSIIEYFFEVKISHSGHIIGFLFGILFCIFSTNIKFKQ